MAMEVAVFGKNVCQLKVMNDDRFAYRVYTVSFELL